MNRTQERVFSRVPYKNLKRKSFKPTTHTNSTGMVAMDTSSSLFAVQQQIDRWLGRSFSSSKNVTHTLPSYYRGFRSNFIFFSKPRKPFHIAEFSKYFLSALRYFLIFPPVNKPFHQRVLVPAAEIRDHETGLVSGPFSWFQSRQLFLETHETDSNSISQSYIDLFKAFFFVVDDVN